MSGHSGRWIALALAGLLVVAGVTLAINTLISQPVGLVSEPLDAGEQLAPARTPAAGRDSYTPAKPARTTSTATTRTSTGGGTPPVVAPAPTPARTVAVNTPARPTRTVKTAPPRRSDDSHDGHPPATTPGTATTQTTTDGSPHPGDD
jgi:hypothetical protein